jgi:hypothetical protein
MATGLPPELIAALAQQQAGAGPPLPGPAGPGAPPMGLPPAPMLALPHLHRAAALRRPHRAPAGPAGLAGALRTLVP